MLGKCVLHYEFDDVAGPKLVAVNGSTTEEYLMREGPGTFAIIDIGRESVETDTPNLTLQLLRKDVPKSVKAMSVTKKRTRKRMSKKTTVATDNCAAEATASDEKDVSREKDDASSSDRAKTVDDAGIPDVAAINDMEDLKMSFGEYRAMYYKRFNSIGIRRNGKQFANLSGKAAGASEKVLRFVGHTTIQKLHSKTLQDNEAKEFTQGMLAQLTEKK